MLVNLHDGCLVTTSIAVVGSYTTCVRRRRSSAREEGLQRTGKYCHHIAILRPVVPFHDQLVGASDQCEVVVLVEGLRDILAEGVAGPSRRYAPPAAVVGVRPQQIAHGAFMRHFLDTVERTNVVQGVDAGRQPAVETKDLVIDEGRQGKVIEEIGKESAGSARTVGGGGICI